MAESKTVIQGLEPMEGPTQVGNGGPANNFYVRNERQASRGTIVPGMMEGPAAASVNVSADQNAPHQPSSRSIMSGKPVVGFLYSVSRTAAGEFWPLHIGQNTIGQAPTCDIVLPEGTISSEHAVLVVRKMKNPEKVIASISDARSTNGTMLNGVSLGFSAEECKNGDILTIGDNYELFLILVDVAALGLGVSKEFIPVAVQEEEDQEGEFGPTAFDPGMTRSGADFGGYNETWPTPYGGGPSAGGTVGLDGSVSQNKGGTVGM